MLHLLSTYKIYLFIAGGIIVAIIVWLSLPTESSSPSLLVAEDALSESAVERGLVDTLLQLRSVSLSGTIFADPAFMNLRDFGSQIVPEPVGRTNPFAPLSARSTTTRGNTLFAPRP
ncbi:hypothetical protein HY478_03450 [Candidatus Uhrbacteria bacterium]|nr:hypothetical protein [Candidatus Uhrbacteria bacterium]